MLWLLAPLLSGSALDLLAPAVDRLGLTDGSRLIDATMRVLEPSAYSAVAEAVSPEADAARLDTLTASLRQVVDDLGLDATVSGRVKSTYSLHRKLQRTGLEVDQVHDRIAARVITQTVEDCDEVLATLRQRLPIQRAKDYIRTPKPNGYQSLHAVAELDGQLVEVQLRTEAMHAWAESGAAAHWRYKLVA